MRYFMNLRSKALLFAASVLLAMCSTECIAQGPNGKDFGFGLILGDPTGATVKIWTSSTTAFAFDVGASHFGPTRMDADYMWHFDAFRSSIVKMYAAPGISLALGSRNAHYIHRWEFDGPDEGVGVGVRAMFGLNIIPARTPIEMFLEIGPLIGLSPQGGAFDAALGIRFYP
jgi:hypothetical protein